MATFEDNAVVTVEDLNNIAVDLGDTTFSSFSEEKFGVDKLNEITADLVSKGILSIENRCEAIIVDGKVYIQSGVIVFGNGAKIRIEEPIEVQATAGNYIYAFNDVLTGKASIVVSADEPNTENDNVVAIAKLSDEGAVVDLRALATAKALSTAVFSVQTFSNTIIYEGSRYRGTIELGTDLLKRLVGLKITGIEQAYLKTDEVTNCFFDFTNTKTHTVRVHCSDENTTRFEFTLENTTLHWEITYILSCDNEIGDEITISVDMI